MRGLSAYRFLVKLKASNEVTVNGKVPDTKHNSYQLLNERKGKHIVRQPKKGVVAERICVNKLRQPFGGRNCSVQVQGTSLCSSTISLASNI